MVQLLLHGYDYLCQKCGQILCAHKPYYHAGSRDLNTELFINNINKIGSEIQLHTKNYNNLIILQITVIQCTYVRTTNTPYH